MVKQTATYIKIVSHYEIMEDETKDLVKKIRSIPAEGDLEKHVTGGTADIMDSIEMIYKSFPIVIEETKKKLSIVDITIDNKPI